MKNYILFVLLSIIGFNNSLNAQIHLTSFQIAPNNLSSGKLLVNDPTKVTTFNCYVSLMRDAQATGGYVPGNCTITVLYTENPNNLTEAYNSFGSNYESDPSTIELTTPKNVTSSDYQYALANFNSSRPLIAKLPANKTKGRIIFRYKYFNTISGKDVIMYAGTRYNIVLATPTFYNAATSHVFYKNNCSSSEQGSAVTFSVAAGTYSSSISQSNANELATYAIFYYGQAFANANGNCTTNPNKIITYTDFPTYSDTFAVTTNWNTNNISGSTVSFEVYQYGSLKATISNLPNNGLANLNIIQYLQQDGHTFRNVRLKIISDSNSNNYETTPGVDWYVD